MKYYLIAGEASGDLHASHLISALKAEDPQAEFRGFGGNLMQAAGLDLVRHYRDLAYMGVVPVILHARTILRGLQQCKEDLTAWQPDVVILVDYPGFNLKIARYVHARKLCPVYYYIAPKLWAWKERRIKDIRRDVDELFSILPFEKEFFEGKHHYPIHYVGNPTVDEISKKRLSPPPYQEENNYLEGHAPGNEVGNNRAHYADVQSCDTAPSPTGRAGRETGRTIALLCGSRKQEIRNNLPRMLAAAAPFSDRYRLVIAGAPSIDPAYYQKYISAYKVEIVYNQTYDLLSQATAALVTSGTATLETALFRVPQVVCYFMQFRHLATLARKIVLKIPYISLVNLVAGQEVVPELVAEQMTVGNCRKHLESILPGGEAREAQLRGYEIVAQRLGEPGAPQRAAKLMVALLGNPDKK